MFLAQKKINGYRYSDMTGFNNRIVNPTLQPFEGYWIVIHDSGVPGLWWDRISWTAAMTNGCAIEVYVRANDDRLVLAREPFVLVTNNVVRFGVSDVGPVY